EQRTYNGASSSIQLLERVQLNQTGIDTISQMFPELGKVETRAEQKRGKILGWLIQAWSERDIIAKFNALFIPLEMILDGVRGTLSEDLSAHIQRLQNFIQAKGRDDTEQLSSSLKELTDKIRPSLIDRFN